MSELKPVTQEQFRNLTIKTTGDCITKFGSYIIYAGHDVDENDKNTNGYMFSIEALYGDTGAAMVDLKYGYTIQSDMLDALLLRMVREIKEYHS